MSYGLIYILKNKVNGKCYIGQTTGLKERLVAHKNSVKAYKKGKRTSPYLVRAIIKYGWDNFEHEILKVVKNKKELDHQEIKLIKKHKTLAPNGYNLSLGGNGQGKHSEETRKKMSDKKIGKTTYNKGISLSLKVRKNMSIAQKNRKRIKINSDFPKTNIPILTREQCEKILFLRKEGRTYREIASQIGVCTRTIGRVIYKQYNPLRA